MERRYPPQTWWHPIRCSKCRSIFSFRYGKLYYRAGIAGLWRYANVKKPFFPRHAELVSASQIYRMKIGYVYIMTNKWKTTFYVGVTADLAKRIIQHKTGKGSEFTGKHHLTDLVYYERIGDIAQAIKREKQLKNWHRSWKINLIKSVNPEMKDLSETGLEWLL